MIKSYARAVLKLDTDRLAGLRNRLVLTCSAIPDRVRGEGRIFQIAKVAFEETLEDFEQIQPLLHLPGPDFVGVQIMFKLDVPGYNGTYHILERIPPNLLQMVPAYEVPVAVLA